MLQQLLDTANQVLSTICVLVNLQMEDRPLPARHDKHPPQSIA